MLDDVAVRAQQDALKQLLLDEFPALVEKPADIEVFLLGIPMVKVKGSDVLVPTTVSTDLSQQLDRSGLRSVLSQQREAGKTSTPTTLLLGAPADYTTHDRRVSVEPSQLRS